MATTPLNQVIQHLVATGGRDGDGTTDGELLTRFLGGRDDDALTALVRRHGPMVWGVCCRLLRTQHDAEDAFQATFLVLVQKAATLPDREAVGNWLYGVARQTAVRVRALVAKRGVREQQVAVVPEPVTADQYVWNDLLPVLDEELSRLPDKYRVLIVLCDLEGVTRKEVSRRLGIPEGTAASRLAAARALLAKRLTRRGVAVSGVLLGAVLSHQSAWSGVPTAVTTCTIKAATLVAAGHPTAGAVSPTVTALTRGVTKAMFVTKIKGLLAAVLVGVGLCGAVGGVALLAAQDDKPTPKDRASTSAQDIPKTPPEDIPKSRAWKDDARPKSKDELAIQGVWTLVDVEVAKPDGAVKFSPLVSPVILPDPQAPKGRSVELVVTNDLWVWKERGKDLVFNYRIDAKQNPKHLALKPVEDIQGGTYSCIYKIDGDTLTVCESFRDRPTEFKAGPGNTLYVFKRSKTPNGREKAGMDEPKKDGPQPKAQDIVTAWGKEVNGLQAGLGLRPGEKRAYRHGDTVTLVVRVRNVGTQPVTFQYLRQFFDENSPVVTNADGKPVPQPDPTCLLGFHVPVEVTVGPGKEVELESRGDEPSGVMYELQPAGGVEERKGVRKKEGTPLRVGTGKVGLQYERVFGNSSAGRIKVDPDLLKLATGKLELDVTDEPLAEQNDVRGVWKLVTTEPPQALPRLRDGTTGRWVAVDPPPVELDVSTDMWVWKERGEGRAFLYDIDATQNPKRLDLKLVKRIGPGVDTLSCIYKIDGDTLTVCESSSKDRPKEFRGEAGNTLFVFKRSELPKGRDKAGPDDQKRDDPHPKAKGAVAQEKEPPLSSKELDGTWWGEKDGVVVWVTFTGADDARWTVNEVVRPDVARKVPVISADLKREDGKPGWVHLRFNSTARPTGTVLARLERGDGGTLKVTILPAASEINAAYKAVEGLTLRKVEPEKTGADGVGEAVDGLRLKCREGGSSWVAGKGSPTHFEVTMENVGDADLNVNLGVSSGNGKAYHPTAIRFVLIEGKNTTRLTYAEPKVAGRLDPFVVPLTAGGSYRLYCPVDKLVRTEGGGAIDWAAKDYRVVAELVGQPVTETGADLRGFTLMKFWRGTVRSNEAKALHSPK